MQGGPTVRLAALLATLGVAAGCGGTKIPAPTTTTLATQETIEQAPDWYLQPPGDDESLFAVGTATSRDLQLAQDKAADVARMNLSKSIETRYQGLSKRFQEEVGTSVEAEYLDQFTQATKAVVSTTLTGVIVDQRDVQAEQGVYRGYVLLRYPVGAASKLLLDQLREREQLWTRYRSAEVFQELEREVDAFDEYRAAQGH